MNYEKDEQIEKDYTPRYVKVIFKNGFERVYKPVVLREKLPLGSFFDIEVIDAGNTYLVGILK